MKCREDCVQTSNRCIVAALDRERNRVAVKVVHAHGIRTSICALLEDLVQESELRAGWFVWLDREVVSRPLLRADEAAAKVGGRWRGGCGRRRRSNSRLVALERASPPPAYKRVQHCVQRCDSGGALTSIAIDCKVAGISALKAILFSVGFDEVPCHRCPDLSESTVVAKNARPDDVEPFAENLVAALLRFWGRCYVAVAAAAVDQPLQ